MNKYQETVNRYKREKVDKIEIYVPKGEREKIKEFAKNREKSMNNYIIGLIKKDMEQYTDYSN